jgi:hypothetical protein
MEIEAECFFPVSRDGCVYVEIRSGEEGEDVDEEFGEEEDSMHTLIRVVGLDLDQIWLWELINGFI